MKKTFTKLFSTGLLMGLTCIGFAVQAQTTTLANGDGTQAAPAPAPAQATFAPFEPRPDVITPDGKKNSNRTTAGTAAEDTSWKPQRRVWGYAFGDYYYDGHSPAITSPQGKENSFYQVPTYRNAFVFRRIYLGYDYEITKKFKAELLLASEPVASTPATTASVTSPTGTLSGTTSINNGDNLADNKMAFYIKNINIRMRDLWTGTDFVIGELSTPGFALNEPGTNGPTSLSESTWAYRSVERTITDFHKNNSFDVGAALQGTFDPETKNFGYVLQVGNNSQASLLSAASANTGFYKIFYGDIWGKFANQHLYVDIYADYAKTAPATAAIPGQEHNMYKLFVAYLSKPINIGVEAYTQNLASGVENKATSLPEDATVNAATIWVRGPVTKTLNYFARYDTYNPDTNFNTADAYSANTNYSSYDPAEKERFVTFGLDYNPTKNVHFMPNVWFVQYMDQELPTGSGYIANNHTIVYRMTFFFTFGK